MGVGIPLRGSPMVARRSAPDPLDRMNISVAFPLEDPAVSIPWGISDRELTALLGTRLRNVTTGYFTMTCTSLAGLEHELGFHFEPRSGGRLVELEFFRRSYADQAGSFKGFQDAFERAFGPPSSVAPGDEGFPTCDWQLGKVMIRHFVFDRFGPEEHMRVRWHAV